MILFVAKAILMMILPHYRVSIPDNVLHGDIVYIQYHRGEIEYKTVIKNNSKQAISMNKFLMEERSGWRYDIATYAPVSVYSSDTAEVNCSGNGVIINYKHGDTWIQVSKTTVHQCPNHLPTKANHDTTSPRQYSAVFDSPK